MSGISFASLIKDQITKQRLPVSMKPAETGFGIGIAPEGFETMDGHDEIIWLEHYDGKLRLVVWADKEQEDPTHIIELEKARA